MARKKKRTRSAPTPMPASKWDALSSGRQHLVCLLILAVVAGYFCYPTLFSGKYLIGGDTVQWRATAESMIEYREETGEEPLWATNVFAGMPGLVISPPPDVWQVDYLPGWLRIISWPLSHLLVLLLGAYLFVCYLTKDKLLGLFAATAYGLTTYLPIILVAGHNTKFIALAYAPWLLWAFVYALRRPGLLSSLLMAVAVSISLRAGHVQIPYYVGMVCLVWYITALVGAIRGGSSKAFLRTTAFLALGVVVGALMVTQEYWPTYEYKAYTIRGMASGGGEGALDWGYAMSWSQGRIELLTLLIADAFGGGSLYWGPKTFTGGPHYVGGIVLLCAIVAVWRVRTRTTTVLGIAAGLMLLFSLGSNFAPLNRLMFAYFPLFDAFRVPETWLIIVALVLAVLGAKGMGYMTRPEGSEAAEGKKWRAVYTVAGVLVGFTLLLYAAPGVLLDFEKAGERERYQMLIAQQAQRSPGDAEVARAADQFIEERLVEPRKEAFAGDALRTLLFLLLASGGLLLFRRRRIPSWRLQLLLIALMAIDLGGVARRYFSEDHLSPRRNAESRVQTLDVDQYILQQEAAAGGAGQFRVLSLEVMDQTKNGRPSFHHESLGGYSGAKLRLYQDFLENILTDPATGLPNANALDMMNARYVIGAGGLPGLPMVYQGSQLSVLENDDALPRAWLVGEVETLGESSAVWSRLRDPGFVPATTAIVDEGFDPEVVPIDSTSTASVTLDQYGPREMAISVSTDAPRMLVLSEVYYPAGWEATIDGESAPIHRVNYLLRGIPVPAGDHSVVLRFDPQSYEVGRWISIGFTLLAYLSIGALVALAWRRRRAGHRES